MWLRSGESTLGLGGNARPFTESRRPGCGAAEGLAGKASEGGLGRTGGLGAGVAGVAGAGWAGAAASEDAVACGADEDEDGCVGESLGVSAPLSSAPDARTFTPGAAGTKEAKGRPPRSSGPARAFGVSLSGPMTAPIRGPNSSRRAFSRSGLTAPTMPLLVCRLSVAESEGGNGRLEQTHCLIEPPCHRHRVERVRVTTSPLGNHPREQQEQKATTTTTIWPTTREEVKNWKVIS